MPYAQKIRKEEFSWANIETKLGVNQDIDPHVRSGQKIPLCQFSEQGQDKNWGVGQETVSVPRRYKIRYYCDFKKFSGSGYRSRKGLGYKTILHITRQGKDEW